MNRDSPKRQPSGVQNPLYKKDRKMEIGANTHCHEGQQGRRLSAVRNREGNALEMQRNVKSAGLQD